jgi:hypothetical protein
MKKIIIILILLAFFCSCKKQQKMFPKNFTGISFFTPQREINVNFNFYPKEQKEVKVKIPLRIQGIALNKDRYYSVSIVKDKTTAKEVVHYKKLDTDKFIFHKNLYQDTLTITVLRTEDKAKVYTLTIKLNESDDFKLGVKQDNRKTASKCFDEGQYYRLQLSINTSETYKIAPEFWGYYVNYGYLSKYISYHPEEVKKFVEIAKITGDNWRAGSLFELSYFVRKTEKWFKDHPKYNENGKRLLFEGFNEEEVED